MSTASSHTVLKALERDLIRDEFRPSGLLLPEVQAPGSDRRADAIWMTARTAHIVGYEIKVTRADLLTELRDPTKCEPWLKYCDRWWLAVGDASIVEGLMDRIPDDWGFCTPPTKPSRRMMTVLKEAPKLVPADKGPVLGKLISHQAYRALDMQRQVDQARAGEQRAIDRADNRDRNHLDHLQRQANPFEKKFAEVAAAYDKLRAPNGYAYPERLNGVSAEVIAQAILHGEQAAGMAQGVERATEDKVRELDRALEELGKSREMRRLRHLFATTRKDGAK